MITRCTVFMAAALISASAWAANVDEGVTEYHKHQFAKAEGSLKAAAPDDARGQLYLARTLAANKKPGEAKAALERATEAGATEAQVKTAQAAVAIEVRDVATAERLLNEAIAVDAEYSDAYHYRGQVRLSKKDFQGAAADLEKAIELDPNQPYHHYYAGMAYNGLKRPDKMVEHLQTYVRMAPDSPDADKVQSLLRAFR